ncbi:hypothetical protein ONZ43_g2716 [Nemania bipapillata]|uniref:Uncharacterized protein n=1 Tax=Nemania bipapillata TaxID=110536 RepID=A0ACC2IZH4_9PEZI|nr:hypothetical protein ONZ43_g2716 [Nemania bipapillata]
MLGRMMVAWVWVALVSVVFAADSTNLTLNDIPQCGTICIGTTVAAQSSCALTDFPCICANEALSKKIESCISTQCPPREALLTARIVKDTCGVPKRNRSLAVWLVSLVNIIFSAFFYFLRLMSRVVLRQKIDASDVFLGISVAFTFPVLWVAFSLAAVGLGQDAWNIPPDNITRIFYLYWWAEIFYQGGLPLTRISFLCFYLKIFPQERIRRVSFVLIGLNAADFIAFVFASIFQCYPIYGAWTAGINIAMDLMVIILPLPVLSNLTISRGRKIHIIVMFSLGFFITIISVIRLKTLVVFANSTNVSYDYVEPGLYSIIEASIGIICACLPAVRALLITVMPSVFHPTVIRSIISSGKGPRTESSRQKFDRLQESNSYDDPTSPSTTKPRWPTHDNEMFTNPNSESNVELMPLEVRRGEVSLESGLHEEADSKLARNTNSSWPLAHEGEDDRRRAAVGSTSLV